MKITDRVERAGGHAMSAAHDERRLLSRDDIENEYGITRRWLELAAHRGEGPPMVKISGRMVRYRRGDFESWLAERTIPCDDAVV